MIFQLIFLVIFALLIGAILVFRVIETIHYFSEWKRLSPGEKRPATANMVIHIVVCIILVALLIAVGAWIYLINR